MPVDWFPLWLSLRVAVISTLLSVGLGLWLAYLLAKLEFRGKDTLDAIVTLPLVLPPTVLGYYLLVLIGRETPLGRLYEWLTGSPLTFTWQAAVVAAVFHSLPLMVKWSRTALEAVDSSFEDAARSLGSTEWRVFWRISLPLAGRSIIAAAALCFARSLGDFGVTIMVAGNIPGRTQTIAVAIYDAVEAGQGEVARWLTVTVSLIAILTLTFVNRWSRRQPA